MVVPFMIRRIPITLITVMPRMTDMGMVIDLTAITGLGHAFTAGVGEAMAGEDMVGIETEILHKDHRLIQGERMDNSHVKVNLNSL